jgi:hypothetical protein
MTMKNKKEKWALFEYILRSDRPIVQFNIETLDKAKWAHVQALSPLSDYSLSRNEQVVPFIKIDVFKGKIYEHR